MRMSLKNKPGKLTPSRYALLVLVVLLLAAAVWWLKQGQGQERLESIKAKGELRVGLDASFPPFETVAADGAITGLDVKLAEAMAGRIGVKAAIVNIGFDGLYDALLAKKVDILISGLPYDERRTRDVHYSASYFNAGQVLLAPAGDTTILSRLELGHKKVAVEWGSQGDMQARALHARLSSIEILTCASAQEAIQKLIAGEAQAAITDAVSARQFGASQVRVVEYLTNEPYVIATRKSSTELARLVEDELSQLQKDGRWAQWETSEFGR
jgi:ABC-type amino acid transport substrate-binding protein